MSDLEKRVSDLERRLDAIEPHINLSIPLGPRPKTDEEIAEQAKKFTEAMMKMVKKDAPPVDRSQQQLISGAGVPEDRSHTELKSNGQQNDYVVLSEAERAKGFVRPVRTKYQHVGIRPKYPTRELTPEERERYDKFGYVRFEQYPNDPEGVGRFWTQARLDSGCGVVTTMSMAIAETYARDPKFYGGTFCCGCGKHLPVDEFVWDGTNERVGS